MAYRPGDQVAVKGLTGHYVLQGALTGRRWSVVPYYPQSALHASAYMELDQKSAPDPNEYQLQCTAEGVVWCMIVSSYMLEPWWLRQLKNQEN